MKLEPNGIDLFYIDESEKFPLSVVSCVRVPFLRPKDGGWQFVWADYLKLAEAWRRSLSKQHSIRFREELHGYKILKHQGQYHKTWRNLSPTEAVTLYRAALSSLTWLPATSIMSVSATNASELMGHKGLSAALYGLFQRLRSHCEDEKVNGMVFFDEGHPAYVRIYRQAQKYMPTGSALGGWGSGATKNLPLSMFPKDGNIKQSNLSYFMQIADLACYAARLKLEQERGTLAAKRIGRGHHLVYDSIAAATLNKKATRKRADAIAPV